MNISEACHQFQEAKKFIDEYVNNLPNYGRECECEHEDTYDQIWFAEIEGDPAVMRICLNCGGFVEIA